MRKDSLFTLIVVIIGTVAALVNVYKFSDGGEAGNTVFAAIALVCFGFLLVLELIKMKNNKK